jgi:hypothetical protein
MQARDVFAWGLAAIIAYQVGGHLDSVLAAVVAGGLIGFTLTLFVRAL